MKSVLTYGVAAICLVALGAGAALYAPLPDPDKITALGGTWSVPVENWHEMAGEHRAQVVMVPDAVELNNVPAKDLMRSLCDGFVQSRAGQVDGGVYRVDINILTPGGDLAYPQALPIPVADGACDPDRFADTFFPVYPGDLSGWFLAGSGVANLGETLLRTVTFQPVPETQVAVSDFPFAQACDAVRQDPLARREVRAENVVIPAIGAGALVIRASEGVAGGAYLDRIFKVSNTGCELLQG